MNRWVGTAAIFAGASVVHDKVLRGALLVSAVYNVGGGLLFAFPSSTLGQLAGLPTPVPAVYSTLLALFIVLFGGAYAWLARQPTIDRPLVALAAIGKSGVFVVVVTFWFLGDVPGRGVLAATGDLVFAGIFAWWLVNAQPSATDLPSASDRHGGIKRQP